MMKRQSTFSLAPLQNIMTFVCLEQHATHANAYINNTNSTFTLKSVCLLATIIITKGIDALLLLDEFMYLGMLCLMNLTFLIQIHFPLMLMTLHKGKPRFSLGFHCHCLTMTPTLILNALFSMTANLHLLQILFSTLIHLLFLHIQYTLHPYPTNQHFSRSQPLHVTFTILTISSNSQTQLASYANAWKSRHFQAEAALWGLTQLQLSIDWSLVNTYKATSTMHT